MVKSSLLSHVGFFASALSFSLNFFFLFIGIFATAVSRHVITDQLTLVGPSKAARQFPLVNCLSISARNLVASLSITGSLNSSGWGEDNTLNEASLVLWAMVFIPACSSYPHSHEERAAWRSHLFYPTPPGRHKHIWGRIQMSVLTLVTTVQGIWILPLTSGWQKLHKISSVPKARHCTLFF